MDPRLHLPESSWRCDNVARHFQCHCLVFLGGRPGGSPGIERDRLRQEFGKTGRPAANGAGSQAARLDQTRNAAKFDPGTPPAGYAVKSIFCARSDIVPAPSDYKVVQAGYPLMIFARDKEANRTRIAVLEMDKGQLRLRSVGEAGFTPEMTGRIQKFLDASLPEFGKIAQ